MTKVINPLTILLAMVGAIIIGFLYDEGIIGDKGGEERRVAASYMDGQTNLQRLENYRAKPKPELLSRGGSREVYCGTTDLGAGQAIGFFLRHNDSYRIIVLSDGTTKKWPQDDPSISVVALLKVNKLTGEKLVGMEADADYKLIGSTVSTHVTNGITELFPKDGFILEKNNDGTITLQNSDGSLKVKLDKSTSKYPDAPRCMAMYELNKRVIEVKPKR